jgi:hypothetical protein
MEKVDHATFSWQSTDLWFDDEGQRIPVSDISDAVARFYNDFED